MMVHVYAMLIAYMVHVHRSESSHKFKFPSIVYSRRANRLRHCLPTIMCTVPVHRHSLYHSHSAFQSEAIDMPASCTGLHKCINYPTHTTQQVTMTTTKSVCTCTHFIVAWVLLWSISKLHLVNLLRKDQNSILRQLQSLSLYQQDTVVMGTSNILGRND